MFGKRLNTIRKQRGYTALQMSELLQIGLRSYRYYESGHREPSYQTLIGIADTLNVSVDWLLGRDDFLKSLGVSFDEYL